MRFGRSWGCESRFGPVFVRALPCRAKKILLAQSPFQEVSCEYTNCFRDSCGVSTIDRICLFSASHGATWKI